MTIELVGALVIGLTVGLLGSGGSAMTVPVLVYLVGHGAKQAIAESMAIVGLISVAAALPYTKAKLVDWRSVWYFGVPGMLGTLVGAWLGGMAPDTLQLAVLGGVLLTAAILMVRQAPADSDSQRAGCSPTWKVALEGSTVGVVTGFVGVGGGFLIVPALVVLGCLPIRTAIGTSLVIVAAKAGIGFAKYQHYLSTNDLSVDTSTISLFVLLGVLGSLVGKSLNARLSQSMLQYVFAGFLIALGGFVLIHEGSKLAWSYQGEAHVETRSSERLSPLTRTPYR